MIARRIEDILEADVTALIQNQVREGRTIEYKLTLPGGTDSDKKEFLADVSSFANSAGGDILYGVAATDGQPTAITPLPGFNADADTLRLENMLRTGLDPRIPGLRTKAIPVTGGSIFLVRVPKSWASPHRVSVGDASRFFSRSSAGKFSMDTDEIRAAFDGSSELPAKIRYWRDERVAKIMSGDTPIPIAAGPKMVLQVIPADAFSNSYRLAATSLSGRVEKFWPIAMGSGDYRINIDGFLVHGGRVRGEPHGNDRAYCQVFRSGIVESAASGLAEYTNNVLTIASIWFEKELLEATARYMKSLTELGVQPPFVIAVTFVGVKGAVFSMGAEHWVDQKPIDRDVLLLPDVLLEEIPADLPRAMRPLFDAAWNAAGVVQSLNYDNHGNWGAPGVNLRGVPVRRLP
jgi:hypothetical protein